MVDHLGAAGQDAPFDAQAVADQAAHVLRRGDGEHLAERVALAEQPALEQRAPLFAALAASPAGADAALLSGGGVGLGYAAHVAADACTPGGVRLWAFLSPKRVWLLPPRVRIPTGSLREAALAGVAAVTTLATILLA